EQGDAGANGSPGTGHGACVRKRSRIVRRLEGIGSFARSWRTVCTLRSSRCDSFAVVRKGRPALGYRSIQRTRKDTIMVNAYLHFPGTCAEAFRFYEKLFGGKITMLMTHGESPMKDQVPADWGDKVIHVSLELPGGMVLG